MVHGIQRVAFALTALGVLLLAACTGAERSGRPQVGVTLLTEVHVFYQDSKRGMLEAADSLGLDLRIVAGEWDLARRADPRSGHSERLGPSPVPARRRAT
jgi:ABC-type sugar transport system substrate-binding protein